MRFSKEWVTFGEYFGWKGTIPSDLCGVERPEISLFRMVLYRMYTHLIDRQTDRIARAIPCVALHAVAR